MQTTAKQTEHTDTPHPAVNIQQVQIEHLKSIGVLIHDLILEVVERSRGSFTPQGISEKLYTQDWQLWVIWEGGESNYKILAAFATELHREMGGGLVCSMPFATGEHSEKWVHLLEEVETWARRQGCTKMKMSTRPGWARRLGDYKKTHIILEKDLDLIGLNHGRISQNDN